jgi:hypothetical protein
MLEDAKQKVLKHGFDCKVQQRFMSPVFEDICVPRFPSRVEKVSVYCKR